MFNTLTEFFARENIEFYSSFPISSVDSTQIVSRRRLPDFAKTVIVFLIPYYVGDSTQQNVSEYAVPRDYHLYIKELAARFTKLLAQNSISAKTAFFADTSPFDERSLAKKAHMGFIGKNGLLINEKYGSFCFIGELLTDADVSVQGKACTQNECINCGMCEKSCPSDCFCSDSGGCVSHLTQKKQLNRDETQAVVSHPYIWGCDICQQVCPHNKNIEKTPIEFFRDNRIPYLDSKILSQMTEDEFSSRAYSWRGKQVIERNICLKNL